MQTSQKLVVILAFPLPKAIQDQWSNIFEFISNASFSLTTEEEILALVQNNQPSALMVSFTNKVTADFIEKLPSSVRIIATCSVGFDHIDTAYAAKRGIWVTHTPDVLTDATADLAILLMLGACRRIRCYIHTMEQGWGRSLAQNEMLGLQVTGRTLGILGMGRIGQAVAQRARAFGMKILYCNRHKLPTKSEHGATYFSDFREMLPHCQILSLHAPGTPETESIMNDNTFALLPKDAILVNVARGSLVDENSLIRAIERGQLFGAGLDVFRNEPSVDKRLIELPQMIFTPHVGSATEETRSAMATRTLENVHTALLGQTPRDAIGKS